MSGPKSASYSLYDERLNAAHRQLMRALEAEFQREVSEARARKADEARAREAEARARAEQARQQEQARASRLAAVRDQRRRVVALRSQLADALSVTDGGSEVATLPQVPEIHDETMEGLVACGDELASIERRLGEVGHRVATARILGEIDLSGLGAAASVGQVLDRFVEMRRQSNVAPEKTRPGSARRAKVDQIVGRLSDIQVNDLPPTIESLLQRALEVDGNERFDMLCTELRLQVQQFNERLKKRERWAETARDWLGRLEPLDVEGAFADLRESINDVAAGRRPWDEALEATSRSALAGLEEAARKRRDEQAARILELTLRDLGYDVEGIEHTLFGEGGAVYFQGSGWNDYFMRLRVSPNRKGLHFNMVRSGEATASAERDREMEQQWCAGYSKLLEALVARGIDVSPTRSAEAGEYAVETVRPEALPRRVREATRRAGEDVVQQAPLPKSDRR